MASGLTPTYLLPYPLQTDPVDVASDTEDLATAVETALLAKAPLASPTFTGVPAAPTAGSDTSTTQIATTQFVVNQGYLKSATASTTYAPLASPAFTGNPTATTQTLGNNTTRIATTAFVSNALANFVTLPAQSFPATNGQYLFSNGTDAAWGNIAIKDVTNLETTINNLPSTYAPLNLIMNTQSSGYTLVLTDAAKQVEMNSGSANSLLIPTDASVAFPVGTTIIVVQLGTGQTTISAVTPGTTTVRYTPGNKLRTQYSTATLVKRAANDWILSGDLIA
jgi:hypothetical protein